MKLKKQFENIIIYFDIHGNSLSLEKENVLVDIINSLDDFKFINRDQTFDNLIKIQQKYPKHILVNYEPKQFDELKFKIKSIYNFLSVTNQIKNFMLDSIETTIDDETIIIYSTEILREDISSNTTFSPLIRSQWTNPDLVEKILLKY